MNKKPFKKALSLTEVLVSLACVGILVMILVPTLVKTVDTDKEKFLYKKAVNSMQNAISSVISDYEAVNAANFLPELSQNTSLREQLAAKFNTSGGLKSVGTGGSSATNPDFYSQDGMIWWDIPETWPAGRDYIDVKVDINGLGGKNKSSTDDTLDENEHTDRLRVRIMKDGRVIVPEGSIESDYITTN